jgi:hypothetical protein
VVEGAQLLGADPEHVGHRGGAYTRTRDAGPRGA